MFSSLYVVLALVWGVCMLALHTVNRSPLTEEPRLVMQGVIMAVSIAATLTFCLRGLP